LQEVIAWLIAVPVLVVTMTCACRETAAVRSALRTRRWFHAAARLRRLRADAVVHILHQLGQRQTTGLAHVVSSATVLLPP
jgi:hypothetical protein